MVACACGERFRRVAQFFAHRDSGLCRFNAPSGTARFVSWALGVGYETLTAPKTEEQRVRAEERAARDKERLDRLKADPEVQAKVKAKRERAREERRRRRESATMRARVRRAV